MSCFGKNEKGWKTMKDERVIQTSNKIWSELGKLVYYFAAVAFFTKIIFLQMKLDDCVVEYIILIGCPVYQLIRSWQLKLTVYEPVDKKKYWRREIGVIAAAVAIYIMVFLGGSGRAIKENLVMLLAFVAALHLTRSLIFSIDRKRRDKLRKEYEDSEDEE